MARSRRSRIAEESKTAVFAAIIGNLLIATTKFIAAAFTASSAMLSEGIHSLVDTGNGLMMLLGIRNSRKPPDDEHPFGHGRELYFWTLIVAVSIFAVGGGVSAYQGVSQIIHPSQIENPGWNYVVLGASFVFEGISWLYGWRAFSKTRRGNSVIKTIHISKDPTNFTVMLEDSTAILGLTIAFIGVLLSDKLGINYFDGIASVLIGLLLSVVALFLGYESRGLLIGEAVDRETLRGIRQIAESQPDVEKAQKILTIYIGPEDVALTLELKFTKGISGVNLRKAVRSIEQAVKEKYPEINRVYYEAESLSEDELTARKKPA
ncbi:MAG TPA: cation diffusion facilitator family transporter [Pyrinomonadaceae bacterium]|nr:cation diffusion facilitator family transporter [Pyrinomonadaceae bacterium]